MADFEKAVKWLGRSDQFAEFVKLRDPLLDGEDSRFLRLADGGEVPALPETAELVIHELHHVPFTNISDYLRFMKYGGLATLKKHGFRPVGPLVVEVGKWSEVTYFFVQKSGGTGAVTFCFSVSPGFADLWRSSGSPGK